jgi:hypothetical protein
MMAVRPFLSIITLNINGINYEKTLSELILLKTQVYRANMKITSIPRYIHISSE